MLLAPSLGQNDKIRLEKKALTCTRSILAIGIFCNFLLKVNYYCIFLSQGDEEDEERRKLIRLNQGDEKDKERDMHVSRWSHTPLFSLQ